MQKKTHLVDCLCDNRSILAAQTTGNVVSVMFEIFIWKFFIVNSKFACHTNIITEYCMSNIKLILKKLFFFYKSIFTLVSTYMDS